MKKSLMVLVALAGLASCATKDKKTTGSSTDTVTTVKTTPAENAVLTDATAPDPANSTTLAWVDGPVKDLGKLKKDQEIEITFKFKNTGDKNLVIENVTAGCGCTIPEKPARAFAPGEEGEIKAKFNGVGSGAISKNITVVANTTPDKNHTLTFNGEIKE